MIDLSSIKISDCPDSKYIKIKQMSYVENGMQKTWDIVRSMDSVSILIYNESRDCVVIVRQFRPAIFLRNNDGYMLELCAGLVDKKGKTVEEIALEEVYEECGYKISNLTPIAEFYSGVGTSGSKQSVFFARVKDGDKVSKGGGVDDEFIEVLEIPRTEMLKILSSPNITPSLGFSFLWFLREYENLCDFRGADSNKDLNPKAADSSKDSNPKAADSNKYLNPKDGE